eukprot:CCRYP_008325-RC/>CCRYP_008325-RC protein AED:0.09 eAED:0.09 QI:169/1/1/1/1/0.88/25/14510/172
MANSSRRTRRRPARGDAAPAVPAAVHGAAPSDTIDLTSRDHCSDSDDTKDKKAKKSPGGAGNSNPTKKETTKRTKKATTAGKDAKSTTSNATPTTASTAALSAILPHSVSDDPSSLLCHLLVQIQSLANSKKRCTDALRALKDGKNVASPFLALEGDGDDDVEEEEEEEGEE